MPTVEADELKPVVFILRATPKEASMDSRWEAFAARRMKALVEDFSPGTEGRILAITNLKALSQTLDEHLASNESFQGLILQGHGSTDSFYMPFIGQELTGKEIGAHIVALAQRRVLHKQCFAYTNACSNFTRNKPEEGDSDLENDLVKALAPLTLSADGSPAATQAFVVMGHRGMAGFFDWRGAWPTDWWFKGIKSPIHVYGFYAVKEQFKTIGITSVLLSYAAGFTGALVSNSHSLVLGLLAGAIPLAIFRGAYNSLRLNHIATQGRAIVMQAGKVYQDEDLRIRRAFQIATSRNLCRKAVESMKSIRLKL